MNYLTNLQLEVHGFHFLVGVPQLLLVLKAPPACRVVIIMRCSHFHEMLALQQYKFKKDIFSSTTLAKLN